MPPVFNPSVQTFCRLVDQDVTNQFTRSQHFYPNLSFKEREALRALNEDEFIVIQPADKGGALVIQDKAAYRKEILNQLGESLAARLLSYTYWNAHADFGMLEKQKEN